MKKLLLSALITFPPLWSMEAPQTTVQISIETIEKDADRVVVSTDKVKVNGCMMFCDMPNCGKPATNVYVNDEVGVCYRRCREHKDYCSR